jgi:hypothetical protein
MDLNHQPKISIKKFTGAGYVPTASQLGVGELGVNSTDGKVYTKNQAGVVVDVTSSSSSVLSIIAGTGVSVNSSTGNVTVTNSAPDKTVTLTSGTGISATGTYPDFTVTNSAPDQTVKISSGTGISATGTYPNFTVASTITQYADSDARKSVSAGTGISYDNTTGIVTNSSPDQTVKITSGTGISATGTYPNFTVTNSSPDQTVVLNSGTGVSVTGTYPNFTVTNSSPDQTVVLNSGTGVSVTGTYPNFTVTNSSPDQTVSLTAGNAISVTGTYPSFTVAYIGTNLSEAEDLIALVRNNTGATLTKGTIVYINGGLGNKPTVAKALATSDATSAQTFGVVRANIANNSDGYLVIAGSLIDMDTSAYTEGTQLYLSGATAGTWTSTKPSAPTHLVYVGVVVRAHPTQGVVTVKIQNGYELDEIHDVSITSVANSDIIQYNSTSKLWANVAGTTKNISEDTNLYYTDTRARSSVSSTATGLTYTSGTGVFSLTSGYAIPSTSSQTNWDTAYTNRITSLTTTGSGAATLVSNVLNIPTPSAATFSSLTVTGSSGSSTLSSGVLNVPTYTLAGLGGIKLTDLSSTATGLTYTNTTGVFSLTSGYAIPTTAKQTTWDTAYTQTQQWSGGATGLTASTGRTSLGATTVGSNLFTLTNPSAVTFPRLNLDNTVTALDAASFRTAIGAGTSSTSGTVTSIATTSPITGGTITGTGTIGINAASANTASFVVQRDASGNFSAGTITATLSGNASTATSATSATSATTATNLAGGGAGQVPYNTASGATSFLAAGTAGQVLQSNGTSAPSYSSRVNYTASSSAPSSPAVGDHWYDTDDAALLVYINDGNTSQWVEAGSPSVGAGAIQSNGRLTLESGVPVSSTDQTAKNAVYFTPYNGNILSLYNGTSWNAYTFSEITLTTAGCVANANYDVFAYVSGSSVALEFSAAWTNDTTRSHALTLLNGVYVKSSDTTRRYIGTVRSNASAQLTDSLANRLVWNFNNKVLRGMYGFVYSLSHSYNGGVREYNNGVSVTRLYFITGISGETFLANATAPITCGGTSANVLFGLDSTTVQFGACVSDDRAATFTRRTITSLGQVNAGFHYLTGLQNTESSGASTYFDFQASGSLLC